ncbi:MAG: SH3 domain-containing protein [Saprospiraceae bacterium]
MKKLTFLVVFTWILMVDQIAAIRSYNEGDTLYVWAQSGLVLREAPDLESNKITALQFGTIVVPQNYKVPNGIEISVKAIAPCTYEGQNYSGYNIPGNWVQVFANGKTGYVFDGYLSIYPPPNSQDRKERSIDNYLARVFGIASHIMDMGTSQHVAKLDCDFYKNGASRQSRGAGDGLAKTTYMLPELSLEEGYLIANHFYKLEKNTNRIPTNPEESDFFLKVSAPYLLEFRADKTEMPKFVNVGCVNGVVVITTLFSC